MITKSDIRFQLGTARTSQLAFYSFTHWFRQKKIKKKIWTWTWTWKFKVRCQVWMVMFQI